MFPKSGYFRAMQSERNAAVVMLGAAMMGLLIANSPFGAPLLSAIAFKLNLEWIDISITVGHVVSDLFLAVFFFVAGLELKYELKLGTLSSPKRALVPVIAAIAGVAVPSSIYAYLNWGTEGIAGWPIPAATDIAFVLGILALFGRGMPKEARIFLLALAIFDDLVAIAIIALFYTNKAEPVWLIATVAIAIVDVAALAGTVDIRPKPSDVTATSAMRFRSVFVDMFFLSVSRRKESPSLRLVIQRDLAIAPLHHVLHTTWVMHRNLCV